MYAFQIKSVFNQTRLNKFILLTRAIHTFYLTLFRFTEDVSILSSSLWRRRYFNNFSYKNLISLRPLTSFLTFKSHFPADKRLASRPQVTRTNPSFALHFFVNTIQSLPLYPSSTYFPLPFPLRNASVSDIGELGNCSIEIETYAYSQWRFETTNCNYLPPLLSGHELRSPHCSRTTEDISAIRTALLIS